LDIYFPKGIKLYVLVFTVILFSIFSLFSISGKEANAITEILSDGASCVALGGIWNGGMHSCNFSSLSINSGNTLTISNGITLINSGNISDSGTISIFYGGTFINSGKITISNKGVGNYGIYNTGIITNSGTITISNSNRIGIYNIGIFYDLCGAKYYGTPPNGNSINNISCTSVLLANSDFAKTIRNIPINIPILSNDSTGTTIQSFTQGIKGTVTGPNLDNLITYTPKKNASGKDSFSYTITDGKKHTATANVIVTILVNPHCSGGHDLSQCDFTYANLPGGKFGGNNLQNVDFTNANLVGADFGGSDLQNAIFKNADLQDAKFGGDNLQNVDFTNANLVGADLGGSDLQGAIFKGADLSGINLSGDNLRNENFEKANLSYANLAGANLSYANLAGANLLGANLSGAKLTGASIAGSNFEGVKPGCFNCR